MGVLRLAVLGPPEVFHDESRLTPLPTWSLLYGTWQEDFSW